MKAIARIRRRSSPTITPQALAWDCNHLWVSSRDLGTLYKIDVETWKIVDEMIRRELSGLPSHRATVRCISRLAKDSTTIVTSIGMRRTKVLPNYSHVPISLGSYLGFDGECLYMSQWYEERILKFNAYGNILREIGVGAEICGHTFVDGMIYVLRGRENKDDPNKSEEWRIARLDPKEENPQVEDLAAVPFAARSLTFDGEYFWSNHRVANETISFSLPSNHRL